MIRRRFPADRLVRIVGWTTLSVAWVTAIVARTVGAPTPPDESPPVSPAVEAPSPLGRAPTIPTMPATGLVVLRSTPAPTPEPDVRTVVVTTPTAGSSSSATSTLSSGS